MIKDIVEFLATDTGIKILEFSVTIVAAYLTAKLTSKNSKKNLTTQYFKERGVNAQEKVLNFWCSLLLNSDFNILESYKIAKNIEESNFKKSDKDILGEIQKDSYIYCSPKTIKAIKDYQQYIYKNNRKKEKTIPKSKWKKYLNEKIEFSLMFILITRIISRMKYDFTGEKVDELDILKIKINDFNLITRIISRIILWYFNIKEIILKLLAILFSGILIYSIFKFKINYK